MHETTLEKKLKSIEVEKEAEINALKGEMKNIEVEKETQIKALKGEMKNIESEKEAKIEALKGELQKAQTKPETSENEQQTDVPGDCSTLILTLCAPYLLILTN